MDGAGEPVYVLQPGQGDEMARARLAIADHHPLLRLGIRSALERDGGFELVGEAASGVELLPLLEHARVEAVLLDFTMPGLGGLECLDRIRSRFRHLQVVVIAAEDDPSVIESAFRHGAVGYIVKTIALQDLGPAVHEALDGSSFRAYGFPAFAAGGDPAGGLTRREREVLHAVSRGLSNREAAAELVVTEQTVKYHLTHVYRKLGVANRTEAVRWAFTHA